MAQEAGAAGMRRSGRQRAQTGPSTLRATARNEPGVGTRRSSRRSARHVGEEEADGQGPETGKGSF